MIAQYQLKISDELANDRIKIILDILTESYNKFNNIFTFSEVIIDKMI